MKSFTLLKSFSELKFVSHHHFESDLQKGDIFYFNDGAVTSIWENGNQIVLTYSNVRTTYTYRRGWTCHVSHKFIPYKDFVIDQKEVDVNIASFIQCHVNK